MEKELNEILENYTKSDYKIVHDTVAQLCAKGVAKGCYQDYTVLMDILKLLTMFENAVKCKD